MLRILNVGEASAFLAVLTLGSLSTFSSSLRLPNSPQRPGILRASNRASIPLSPKTDEGRGFRRALANSGKTAVIETCWASKAH